MESSFIFQLQNAPLPAVKIEAESNASIKKHYDILAGEMEAIANERGKLQAVVMALIPAMLNGFQPKKLAELKTTRVRMMELVQEELDLRDKFKTWAEKYRDVLTGELDKALQVMNAETEEVMKSVLANGFDEQSQTSAENFVATHPKVRACREKAEGIQKAIKAVDDGTFDTPMSINESRCIDLKTVIASELKQIFAEEGLASTVLWAYRNGAECRELIPVQAH